MTAADWIASNPLRLWRLTQTPKLSLRRAADQMRGLTWMALWQWEHGRRKPLSDNWHALTWLTAITWDQWQKWLAQRPKDGQRTRPAYNRRGAHRAGFPRKEPKR
jgi:hypothetical protein